MDGIFTCDFTRTDSGLRNDVTCLSTSNTETETENREPWWHRFWGDTEVESKEVLEPVSPLNR